MRQSQFFTKTLKDAPSGEVSVNAQLLIRAGFIDKLFAGVYSLLPLGWRVIRNIEQIIREEMDAIGGQELHLPALHPIENYQKTGREAIDVLFHTEMANGQKLVLGQSHEEVVTPLVQRYVSSYKHLPQAVYQMQTKFRNELRAKSGIMRGREFRMKDLYSFHTNQEDLDSFYAKAEKAYEAIWHRLELGDVTIKTYASGGTFSKYSHEYQTLTQYGEDTIYTCEKCSVAINKEILADLKESCPECGSTVLKEEKSIEVGNIFKLQNKFSDAFGFTYTDDQGAEQPILMGCYGIGITRALGTIVEIHNDENGIIWPKAVAPYQVHLVSLCRDDDVAKADALYDELLSKGIDVLYDDRLDVRAGQKFADSDLIGIPVRVVVSAKTLANSSVEVKKRAESETTMVSLDSLVSSL